MPEELVVPFQEPDSHDGSVSDHSRIGDLPAGDVRAGDVRAGDVSMGASVEDRLEKLVDQVTQLTDQVHSLHQHPRSGSAGSRSAGSNGFLSPEVLDGAIDGFDFRLQALEQRLRSRLDDLEADEAHSRERLHQLRTTLRSHLDEVGNRDGSSGIWKWITGAAEAELKERIHETLRSAVDELDRVLEKMPADRDKLLG